MNEFSIVTISFMGKETGTVNEELGKFGEDLGIEQRVAPLKCAPRESRDPCARSTAMNESGSRIHGPCPAQMSCHWIVFGPRTCLRPESSKRREAVRIFLLCLLILYRLFLLLYLPIVGEVNISVVNSNSILNSIRFLSPRLGFYIYILILNISMKYLYIE